VEPDEDLVWCKAACGQNFHKQCFEQWRASKKGYHITCVYCRTLWQDDVGTGSQGSADPMASLKASAPKIGSYKNIGHLPMYSQAAVDK
jgi:hypothetical protein